MCRSWSTKSNEREDGGRRGLQHVVDFVDGIDPEALFAALDLTPTGEEFPEEANELGTSRVPLGAATFPSGWSAVFARYALIMDATMGTDPPRLARLPAKSRSITCVVLEHAGVSYSSLWQGGRHVWEIRHQGSQGDEHLEVSGDLPADFTSIRDRAVQKRYMFDAPLEVAATITGFRHDRGGGFELLTNLQALEPTNGNVLTKLSHPPKWWQMLHSIEYQ